LRGRGSRNAGQRDVPTTKSRHHQNPFPKFYTAKAGQTDLGCGIFPGLRKDVDELIYGGPEKFNQSQGG
jgi:hypothetical protein